MILEQSKKLFPAQEKTEQILAILRKHWFTYALFWFVAIMLLIPFVIAVAYVLINLSTISEGLLNVFVLSGSVYLLFLAALMVYGFVDFYLDVYVITNKRIVSITQNGFFKRAISELDVHQIQDVNADVEGFFPTLLHYGNVRIQTAAELPNFIFESIPHPYETSKRIIDLHQAHKRLDSRSGEPSGRVLAKAWQDEMSTTQAHVLPAVRRQAHQKLLQGIEKTKTEEALASGELHEGEKIILPTKGKK